MAFNMFGPTPSAQQLKWHDLELGLFLHFGINTFNDREWGDGTDSPSTFNPTNLDAKQWAMVCRRAGFKYAILTAKHHDGFCLWPTETTDYSVKSSPYKGGKGDVVQEAAEAFAEEGLGFGLYLSPWDRNAACYPDARAYDDFYIAQLTELLTRYGPLVEVWFDGAGSQGRLYDWRRIMDVVAQHQPNAMVFNMGRPTIRWVGNEDGLSPYPCWHVPIGDDRREQLLPDTPAWCPAECDVPIRKKHWFWHPNDEDSLLSFDELLNIYHKSVGYGAGLLLNVSPNNEGLLPEPDSNRLIELGDAIREKYGSPLATATGRGPTLTLQLPKQAVINTVILAEDIAHGQRVRRYRLLGENGSKRTLLYDGTAIGHKHIARFKPCRAERVILHVDQADNTPLISSMQAFV